MLVWLTKFYLSFNASLIERHKHFLLVWESNRAVSVKQRSLCKDVYRAHDESWVWHLLNFYMEAEIHFKKRLFLGPLIAQPNLRPTVKALCLSRKENILNSNIISLDVLPSIAKLYTRISFPPI